MKLKRHQKRYLSQMRKLLCPIGLTKEAINIVKKRFKSENYEQRENKKRAKANANNL